VSASEGVLGARVRALADALAALFEHDRQLAGQLNAAHRRLLSAAEQVQAVTARSAGRELATTVRGAFAEYQQVTEDRRMLGADVGEAVIRLVDALMAAGYTERQARYSDVWALSDGVYREGGVMKGVEAPPIGGLIRAIIVVVVVLFAGWLLLASAVVKRPILALPVAAFTGHRPAGGRRALACEGPGDAHPRRRHDGRRQGLCPVVAAQRGWGRIRDGRVAVWAIDPEGGMELGPGRPLYARFAVPSLDDLKAPYEPIAVLLEDDVR
jgi:hypothetical protein